MPFQLASFLAKGTPGIGVVGAIVGGSAAAAKNYKDYQNGNVTISEAARDVSKEAAGAGVAAAISAAAAGVVGGGLAISLLTAVVVATSAKYAWDRGMARFFDEKTEVEDASDLTDDDMQALADQLLSAEDLAEDELQVSPEIIHSDPGGDTIKRD